MENARIAAILEEIADLIELQGGSAFRVRSYRNAARTIRDLSRRIDGMIDAGEDISDLPHVGKSIAHTVAEIVETGSAERLEQLRAEVPADLTELLNIPQLGPQRAMQIHRELGISSLAGLQRACQNHEVRALKGFGAKSEEKILRGIETVSQTSGRVLYTEAAQAIERLAAHLDGCAAVERWEVAGSFRRGRETIGDLDILLQASDRAAATEQVLSYEPVAEIIGRGEEKASVRLGGGLQVDFRYFEKATFGAALMYFTGSKAHNVALRKRAQQEGWKLSEYGLTEGRETLAGRTEEEIYGALQLSYVPPELREDRGEMEAAEQDALPALIEEDEVRGDLQSHTTASDGTASIEEMAEAARSRGYEFFAITDHSKAVRVANGLDEERLRRHADAIREVDAGLDDLWLMAGVEVDVLKDGSLDIDEDLLADLDWVVASTHYYLELDRKAQTERLVRAIRSGVIHCVGHPLGRILGRREPIEIDFDPVLEACLDHGVRLEINAQPDRLDLPDTFCKQAAEAGVGFTFGTDAHEPANLDYMPLAVLVARRGWLRKSDVLNTRTAKQLRKELSR
jgi:DNA polymerase (family 10)